MISDEEKNNTNSTSNTSGESPLTNPGGWTLKIDQYNPNKEVEHYKVADEYDGINVKVMERVAKNNLKVLATVAKKVILGAHTPSKPDQNTQKVPKLSKMTKTAKSQI